MMWLYRCGVSVVDLDDEVQRFEPGYGQISSSPKLGIVVFTTYLEKCLPLCDAQHSLKVADWYVVPHLFLLFVVWILSHIILAIYSHIAQQVRKIKHIISRGNNGSEIIWFIKSYFKSQWRSGTIAVTFQSCVHRFDSQLGHCPIQTLQTLKRNETQQNKLIIHLVTSVSSRIVP